MATYTWTLQGTSPTTIGATDIVQFNGGSFGAAITVAAYNTGTSVESNVGGDSSAANTPKNSKYLTTNTVDIGGGSTALSGITTANCPLKINFSHATSVVITGHIFYAYDGSTPATAPTEVTFKAAEQADTDWTAAGGSGAAVSITDHTTNTSHDFYLLISASPTTVGLKTAFKLRDELTYT